MSLDVTNRTTFNEHVDPAVLEATHTAQENRESTSAVLTEKVAAYISLLEENGVFSSPEAKSIKSLKEIATDSYQDIRSNPQQCLETSSESGSLHIDCKVVFQRTILGMEAVALGKTDYKIDTTDLPEKIPPEQLDHILGRLDEQLFQLKSQIKIMATEKFGLSPANVEELMPKVDAAIQHYLYEARDTIKKYVAASQEMKDSAEIAMDDIKEMATTQGLSGDALMATAIEGMDEYAVFMKRGVELFLEHEGNIATATTKFKTEMSSYNLTDIVEPFEEALAKLNKDVLVRYFHDFVKKESVERAKSNPVVEETSEEEIHGLRDPAMQTRTELVRELKGTLSSLQELQQKILDPSHPEHEEIMKEDVKPDKTALAFMISLVHQQLLDLTGQNVKEPTEEVEVEEEKEEDTEKQPPAQEILATQRLLNEQLQTFGLRDLMIKHTSIKQAFRKRGPKPADKPADKPAEDKPTKDPKAADKPAKKLDPVVAPTATPVVTPASVTTLEQMIDFLKEIMKQADYWASSFAQAGQRKMFCNRAKAGFAPNTLIVDREVSLLRGKGLIEEAYNHFA